MIEIKNLVYLVWEHDDIDHVRTWLRVTEKQPEDLRLDLASETWTYTPPEKDDPAIGRSYKIGGTSGCRKTDRYRNILLFCKPGLPYGPVQVFDRTNIWHLDELVTIARELKDHKNPYVVD